MEKRPANSRKIILIAAGAVVLAVLLAVPGLTWARQRYSEGDLIRQIGKGTIYRVQKAKRRPILSMDVFRQRRFSWRRVKDLPGRIVRSIPYGRLLVYRNGTLIRARGKGTIWVICRQKRKYIPSMAVFRALGYQGRNIREIRLKKLKKIPYGGAKTLGISRFIRVTANRSFWIKNRQNQSLIRLAPKTIVKVGYRGGVYLVSVPSLNKSFRVKDWIRIKPDSGGICQLTSYDQRYGYNRFRGTIQIRYSSRSNRLWAINRVGLENYLKGMGEAGNTVDNYGDPLTYQKAMAVIARSYAAYYIQRGGRHQGEPFHLKNSRLGNGMDQVYHGYKREFQNQVRAVNRTQGVMITNSNNSILIAPYSHGGYVKETKTRCLNRGGKWLRNREVCLRTRSAKEVWGGVISHCQPAYDLYADRHWRCGTGGNHCVGLSATGAIGYAGQEGRGYGWILKHYYQNVKVFNKGYYPKIKVAIYGIRP